jgi:hypothetical protein
MKLTHVKSLALDIIMEFCARTIRDLCLEKMAHPKTAQNQLWEKPKI